MRLEIEGGTPLVGEIEVPADKSITHRSVMFGAMARGESEIIAMRPGQDNGSTAACMAALGADVRRTGEGWVVNSEGTAGWEAPGAPLDCGNSGTTMRLLAGVLAGRGLACTLMGDESLSGRPMGRVAEPLRQCGGRISGTKRASDGRELPPLVIEGGDAFCGGDVRLNVASAQVKSALLLAGVASGKRVRVCEPSLSRDHTERMLRSMGATVNTWHNGDGAWAEVDEGAVLNPLRVHVPGDISSAAFWLVAGAMVPGAAIAVKHVGLNPSRTGILDVLQALGAHVVVRDMEDVGGEPVGTLRITADADLSVPGAGGAAWHVAGALIPRLVDELVVLAALFSQVNGCIEVRDSAELRVKESDRIRETVRLLGAFGVTAEERPDGFAIQGRQQLRAATVDVSGDHRLAMAGAVLALAAPGRSVLHGFDIADVSYPGFVDDMRTLGAHVRCVK